MIISRTPYRLSFFGGGTDYPKWFEKNRGAVLATTIDKYCYITCRYLPQFFDHKSRIIYSKMEHVKKVADIEHPAVREVLKFLKIRQGIEIHHDGDLPARTGLGTSSSFTVGLLNSLYALKGFMPTKEQLAKEAIHIEQNMCCDKVGCQDQVLAAYGGFNMIEFGGPNHLRVRQVTISQEKMNKLQNHIMMFFTGFHRPSKTEYIKAAKDMGDNKELKRVTSSEIISHQLKEMKENNERYKVMHQLVFEALDILNKGELGNFGKLLHKTWTLKRTLSNRISNPHIDEIYTAARKAGALGGKILGAGGGGFIVFFAEPKKQKKIREKLKGLLEIPIKFENQGSQIILYQPHTGKVS